VAIADGASGDVGLLIGYTSDEMRLFPDPRADDLDENGLAAWVRRLLTARTRRDVGDDAARSLVRSYLDAMTSTSRSKGSDVWAAIQTDGIMSQPVVRGADTRPESSSTFVYQFDWPAQRSDADLGAFHAIDLPFTFDTFDV